MNYLSGYANGSGQASRSSRACWAARSSSPIGSAPTSACRGRVRQLRAEFGEHVDLRPRRRSRPPRTTTRPSATAASATSTESITDWVGSLGLNYRLTDQSLALRGGRAGLQDAGAGRVPERDGARQQVDLFDSQEVQSVEGGVKGCDRPHSAFTVGGFYTKLKNIVSQGLVIDPVTGAIAWVIATVAARTSPTAPRSRLVVNPARGTAAPGQRHVAQGRAGHRRRRGHRQPDQRRTDVDRQRSRRIYIAPRGLPAQGRLALGGQRVQWTVTAGISLPAYNYFNFGAGYRIPSTGTTDQRRPAERVPEQGARGRQPAAGDHGRHPVFLARPILPRRFRCR